MANMLPVAVYGLKVPAGEEIIEATTMPATFRLTMAALDPSADSSDSSLPPRATLKMLYERGRTIEDDSEGDFEDDDDEEAFMRALREQIGSDEDESEEDSSDDEEKNGGPSDPSKSVKARKEAAAKDVLNNLLNDGSEEDSDDDMDIDGAPKTNGLSKTKLADKGKGKAKAEDVEDDDDSDIDEDDLTEVVLCTLDPSKTYQQPLDITVSDDQRTFFKVSGTHAVYLSGNYVIPPDENLGALEGEDDEYDLSPDEDELDLEDDESDELDDMEDPRIVEVNSEDEEEIPKLVKTEAKAQLQKQKGKNKRPAEDFDAEDSKSATIDDLMSKSLKTEEALANGEAKMSKKQLKKMKNNAGKAVESNVDGTAKTSEPVSKTDKRVQFAKELEQGPSSSPASTINGANKSGAKGPNESAKASTGVKMVQGVKVDDKKLGTGPQAKKGDTLGMRYIGKLSNGKVFDANKKGPPFRFKLGANTVIKGWEIGVAGMSVGGERRITVPAHLAYGSQKTGDIPPNSELTFDIKLLEISKK